MAIQVLKRVFKFKEDELPDPDSNMTPEEVISFYSARYPELVAGHISKNEMMKEHMLYTISHNVGTKG